MRALVGAVACALVMLAPGRASAHAPSDAQLYLAADGDRVRGRLDVALRDLDAAVGLDLDGDGAITWGEVATAAPRIAAYVDARLALSVEAGPCPRVASAAALVDRSDGTYWAQPFTATCPGAPPRALTIRYALLFDLDPQHQAILHLADGAATQTLVARDAQPITAALPPPASIAAVVREGARSSGLDLEPALLLLCLLLPAVAARRGAADRSLRDVVIDALPIVAAFTLASSITLALAAAGLAQLPARFVETAIALSVFAAAANNLVRAFEGRAAIALALGLLHGFGTAAATRVLGLSAPARIGALLGFDLGVGLGLLAIALVAVPVLYALRRTVLYPALRWGGSGAVAVLALVWAYQALTR